MLRFLVIMCVIAPMPHLDAQELPVDYFFHDNGVQGVTLSPSGDYIAMTMRADNAVTVAVMERETQEIVGRYSPEIGGVIEHLTWVGDDRFMFTHGLDSRHYFDFGRSPTLLAAVDFDGEDYEIIAGRQTVAYSGGLRRNVIVGRRSDYRLLKPLERDNDHVLIVEHPWPSLRRRTERRQTTLIHKANVHSGHFTDTEVLRVRDALPFSSTDGRVRFLTRETDAGVFESSYRESETARWRPLNEAFELPSDNMWVVAIDHSGDAAFLMGPYGNQGYKTLFRLDVRSKTLVPLFTDLNADISDWVADPDSGEIVIGRSARHVPRYHYLSGGSGVKALHLSMVNQFKGQAVDLVSTAKGADWAVVRVSSDIDPGDYYVFDQETKTAEFLAPSKSWLDPKLLRSTVSVDAVSDDGVRIPVRLTLPAGEAPAPLILHAATGPGEGSRKWGFDGVAQLLANRGFAVLQVSLMNMIFLKLS